MPDGRLCSHFFYIISVIINSTLLAIPDSLLFLTITSISLFYNYLNLTSYFKSDLLRSGKILRYIKKIPAVVFGAVDLEGYVIETEILFCVNITVFDVIKE